MASPTSPSNTLPIRSSTGGSEEAAGLGDDASEVHQLFNERLQAWKHACGYLEEYIKATEKAQTSQGKEFEKVLKSVNQPLREAHHFDSAQGGVAEMFDTIRTNTMGITNANNECAKTLHNIVLPVFERLHQEIKAKQSEISKNVSKPMKNLDKSRAETQKYVERLGSHVATYTTHAGKPDPANDPYVIHRQIYHRLAKQVGEENSSRQDVLNIQQSFSEFEAHVVQMFQEGAQQFQQAVVQQLDQQKYLYVGMTEAATKIDPLFEWHGFVQRNNGVLIDPNAPPRTLENSSFPNQNHASTQPVLVGSLGRKAGMMGLKKHENGYFAVTPAKWLHEFKSDDDIKEDPSPELSLYLPDCAIGALAGHTFIVKGKDMSKGKIGNAVTSEKEFEFKGHSQQDADKWYEAIKKMTGGTVATPASGDTNIT